MAGKIRFNLTTIKDYKPYSFIVTKYILMVNVLKIFGLRLHLKYVHTLRVAHFDWGWFVVKLVLLLGGV